MKALEKDKVISMLKDELRNLREKLAMSDPKEIGELSHETFGIFTDGKKYYFAEIAFDPKQNLAKITGIVETDKNPFSYNLMSFRAKEKLHKKIIDKLPVIQS